MGMYADVSLPHNHIHENIYTHERTYWAYLL